MKVPLLTVITPVCNGQRFIESCLQTVINQNCPQVEHLIMDGGSTDMTLKIIKGYCLRYAHIRLISEKDRGQSDAMNKGIAMAQGEIIGFLNCDDYYQPNILPKILNIFKKLPVPSLLVGNCNVLNENEDITYLNKPSRISLTNILIRGEKNQFPYNPSAYFYHKNLHEKIGPYDVSNHYTLDLDFILRAVRAAHIEYVDETWGNFRFIPGTKTFRSKVENQLGENEMRVMDVYLKELPWFQRWWIKINRRIQYFFDRHKVHYYADRVKDCIRDPKELYVIFLKKFNLVISLNTLEAKKRHIIQSVHNEPKIDALHASAS